jgi:hypothetical protein
MSLIIKQRSKTNVTIVSPAKVGRYEQGSDPLAQILRNGRIIIFQFVGHYSYGQRWAKANEDTLPECHVKPLKTFQLGIF